MGEEEGRERTEREREGTGKEGERAQISPLRDEIEYMRANIRGGYRPIILRKRRPTRVHRHKTLGLRARAPRARMHT